MNIFCTSTTEESVGVLSKRIHKVVKMEQVGLKIGRCSQCKESFTSYACAARVRVLECPGRLHKGQLLQY